MRHDGVDKVRGRPLYGSDRTPEGVVHAVPVGAAIGKGRIARIDVTEAAETSGVLLVLTPDNMDRLQPAKFSFAGGSSDESFQPMQSDIVAYRGHPVALVVAETLEVARAAAALVSVDYIAEPFSVELHDPGGELVDQGQVISRFPAVEAGDGGRTLSRSPVVLDATYSVPAEHHNPMELLATVAEWRDGNLVVHEGTQAAGRMAEGLAGQLGIPRESIHVISPSLGGAFGQRGAQPYHTVLAAVAARRLGRSVKLVVPRADIFHSIHFRPATEHRIQLGADSTGKISVFLHDALVQTSRHDLMPYWGAETTARMYGIPNFRGSTTLIRLDTQTPGFMRAPMEMTSMFALESALDELAGLASVDPVELRLRNDTNVDPVTGKPFSSRRLADCLRRGAALFGWADRQPEPGSMRAADGSRVGWGMAAGSYPGQTAPAGAKVRLLADGTAEVAASGHEMGQGLRTAIAVITADGLGVAPERIRVIIGDTAAPPQGPTGGSWGTASVAPAILKAAAEVRGRLHALAGEQGEAVGHRAASDCTLTDGHLVGPGGEAAEVALLLRRAGLGVVEGTGRAVAPGQADSEFDAVLQGAGSFAGPVYPDYVTFSYVAHFVEVRVGQRIPRPRVTRMVSVLDCGRVISRRTASSQAYSGLVWGIGAALTEESLVDPRFGGFLNNNLADYEIPVNADVGSLEIDFIDEPDSSYGAFGLKGVGEVVAVGAAAAIANAVYHATGTRVRNLPIRVEDLLPGAQGK